MSVLDRDLFVERMQHCVSQSGWTRSELAEALGVSKATLGRWLTRGKTFQYPSVPQLADFCDLLGVSQLYVTVGAGGMYGPHDRHYREMYRRYVEDPEFATLVRQIAELPGDVLPLISALLARWQGST